MTVRTYSSPEAFKQALEQRLRASATTGSLFARKRQLLVFDRFLARIAVVLGEAATLKGMVVAMSETEALVAVNLETRERYRS